MKTTLLILLALALLCTLQILPADGQVYKWTDDRGVIHFTDDPGQIPEKYQTKAEKSRAESPQQPSPPQTPSSPQPNLSQPGAPPTAKTADVYRDSAGRDESYWKNRVDEWKRKLTAAQEKEQTLRVRYSQLTEKANSTKNQAERYQLRQERDQVKAEMDQQRAQIEEAKRMLDKTIPEEAALFKAKPEWVGH
jgi:hypothetical protein